MKLGDEPGSRLSSFINLMLSAIYSLVLCMAYVENLPVLAWIAISTLVVHIIFMYVVNIIISYRAALSV